MSLRLCYIPHIWSNTYELVHFRNHLSRGDPTLSDHYAIITVPDDKASVGFLNFLVEHGLDKGLVYRSPIAKSYRYPTLPPRLTLHVYCFKGLL